MSKRILKFVLKTYIKLDIDILMLAAELKMTNLLSNRSNNTIFLKTSLAK